jgi:hypothetical protein
MTNCSQTCNQGRTCECECEMRAVRNINDLTDVELARYAEYVGLREPEDYWYAVTWKEVASDLGVAICAVLVAGLTLGVYSGLFARADVVWPGHWMIHFLGGL